jgi:hypothetical protein
MTKTSKAFRIRPAAGWPVNAAPQCRPEIRTLRVRPQ